MNTLDLVRKPMYLEMRSNKDPFDSLYYPQGATGLVVAHCGYDIGVMKLEGKVLWFVLRKVRNSRDYIYRRNEQRCGITADFYDTYWTVKSRLEAKILIAQFIRINLK